MAHTYTCLHYHIVFSTLERRNLILPDLNARVHAYMGGIIRNLEGLAVQINGMPDHVHIVCSLRPDTSPADAVRTIKSNTSRWIHEAMPSLRTFAWQEGYGAFTVSRSNLDAVAGYVRDQEEHHKRMTFQEELVALLRRHGIQYDERYVWG